MSLRSSIHQSKRKGFFNVIEKDGMFFLKKKCPRKRPNQDKPIFFHIKLRPDGPSAIDTDGLEIYTFKNPEGDEETIRIEFDGTIDYYPAHASYRMLNEGWPLVYQLGLRMKVKGAVETPL